MKHMGTKPDNIVFIYVLLTWSHVILKGDRYVYFNIIYGFIALFSWWINIYIYIFIIYLLGYEG